MPRLVTVERVTKETQIRLTLDIDGTGEAKICTSVPFLDHMLNLFARHGLFNRQILDVALLRLRFDSFRSTKPDLNLSAIM